WKPNEQRGVFMSTDGGGHWKKVLYVNDQTGCSSLAMQPGNPQVLIAGMWQLHSYPWTLVNGGPDSGLYRSTDGGRSWQKLSSGFPVGPTGRSAVAFAPSAPETVYALIQALHGMLWVSHDLGSHWRLISNNHDLDVRPFYFSQMAVAPNNPERIFFLSMRLMESKDGGKTVFYADPGVHPDHHAIWIDPRNPERIIQGNDGGVDLSLDGGKSWRYLDTLPIEEFYQVGIGDTVPFLICGGLQDNNAWCGNSTNLDGAGVTGRNWWIVTGGDGQYVVPAPSDPEIIYADSQNGSVVRFDRSKGMTRFISPDLAPFLKGEPLFRQRYRFNWTSPIAVSYTDPNEVYLGANVVFRSVDGGTHWQVISPDLTRNDKTKQQQSKRILTESVDNIGANVYDTIQSISLSRVDGKVIWVGTDDGLVWVTRDQGGHWEKVTPPGAPRWARVYQIGVSPFSAGTAYVAFDAHELGNDHPYIYRTDNYGKSWHPITAGLPGNASVLVVREDPKLRGFLMAGTMTGLYYSRDDGGHWQQVTANLPTMPVWDLKFVKATSSLVVASHGRGIWVLDNLRPLEELTAGVEREPFHLFTAAPGTLFYHRYVRGPAIPYYSAPNAPTGVGISYYLRKRGAVPSSGASPQAGHSPVRIRIETATGQVIDTFSGPAHAGINEAVWDLRYAGPTNLDFVLHRSGASLRSSRGPRVTPGRYVIVTTYAGRSYRTTTEVKGDPRHAVPAEVYAAVTQAGLTVRDELSVLNVSLNRLQDMRVTLHRFEKTVHTPAAQAAHYTALLQQARLLDKKLYGLEDDAYNLELQHRVAEDFLHYLGHLHGQMQRLYGMVAYRLWGERPSAPLQTLMTEERSDLQTYLERYNALITTRVAAYNHEAYATGAPTLFSGQPLRLPPEVHIPK
ncbi:MAG: WD40/YVTN/BNR-like repeat-containing protein, partial [Gammaproteobacteria bacterium]